MGNINENILKSLADLEANLKEINSAKEQVNKVVISSENLSKIFKNFQGSFEDLSLNIKSILDDSRKFNLDSIEKLSLQTKYFTTEISKLSDFDVTKSLRSIEKEIIEKFQQSIGGSIDTLNSHIQKIETEVSNFATYDFHTSFTKIEKDLVDQFSIHIADQFNNLDSKYTDFQHKIDNLKAEISRLEKLDLKNQFNKIFITLTSQNDAQFFELSKKYDEIKKTSEIIIFQLNEKNKEFKKFKNYLIIIFCLLIVSIIINFIN